MMYEQNPTLRESIDKLVEASRILGEEIIKVTRNMIEHLMIDLQPVIDVWVKDFTKFCNEYPNQRVVFLAFHAKKNRVRNKNYNRLLNDYIKSLQGGGKSTE